MTLSQWTINKLDKLGTDLRHLNNALRNFGGDWLDQDRIEIECEINRLEFVIWYLGTRTNRITKETKQ